MIQTNDSARLKLWPDPRPVSEIDDTARRLRCRRPPADSKKNAYKIRYARTLACQGAPSLANPGFRISSASAQHLLRMYPLLSPALIKLLQLIYSFLIDSDVSL